MQRLMLALLLLSPLCLAAQPEMVDGEWGEVHVYGELVASPCRLSVDSLHQEIDFGTVGMSTLLHPGDELPGVPLRLQFLNCLSGDAWGEDELTGNRRMTRAGQVVTVSFITPADADWPSLAAVSGVSGLALKIADAQGHPVRLGERGELYPLQPGDNTLVWQVTPVRTPAPLHSGPFRATVNIRLNYD